MPRKRTEVCTKCGGSGERRLRANGVPISWCRSCESRQKSEYIKTDAGKAAIRKYQRSENGKKVVARCAARYQATEKGKAAVKRANAKHYLKKKAERAAGLAGTSLDSPE